MWPVTYGFFGKENCLEKSLHLIVSIRFGGRVFAGRDDLEHHRRSIHDSKRQLHVRFEHDDEWTDRLQPGNGRRP